MPATPTYYTDDITRMPIRFIWRSSRRTSWVVGVPLFLFVLLRKLLGLRFRANYAVMRPDAIPKITREAVPNDPLFTLTPNIEACRSAGFTVVAWTRKQTIGQQLGYAAIMLHESGLTSALAVWLQVTRGDRVHANTAFSCQSYDQSGTQLCTGPLEARIWPELIPPSEDILDLPLETTASETIKAHFDRVRGRNDLVRFDHGSLEQQSLLSAQARYDHMIKQRYYVPITAAEYERLSALSDIIEAELA